MLSLGEARPAGPQRENPRPSNEARGHPAEAAAAAEVAAVVEVASAAEVASEDEPAPACSAAEPAVPAEQAWSALEADYSPAAGSALLPAGP